MGVENDSGRMLGKVEALFDSGAETSIADWTFIEKWVLQKGN